MMWWHLQTHPCLLSAFWAWKTAIMLRCLTLYRKAKANLKENRKLCHNKKFQMLLNLLVSTVNCNHSNLPGFGKSFPLGVPWIFKPERPRVLIRHPRPTLFYPSMKWLCRSKTLKFPAFRFVIIFIQLADWIKKRREFSNFWNIHCS